MELVLTKTAQPGRRLDIQIGTMTAMMEMPMPIQLRQLIILLTVVMEALIITVTVRKRKTRTLLATLTGPHIIVAMNRP
jgi:hypothetical protein